MFAFLNITEAEYGFLSAFRERRTKPQICDRIYYRAAGNSVYRINITQRFDNKEYELLAEKYRNINKRLLAPKEYEYPNYIQNMFYNPERYRLNLLCESACDLLKNSKLSPYSTNIAVLDRNGKFFRFIERLTPYVNRIDIITDKKELYSVVAEKLYHENGIAVTVGRDLCDCIASHAVIAASVNKNDKITNHRIIAGCDVNIDGALRIERVKLAGDIIIPDNIDSIEFAGALADINSYKPAKKLYASAYKYNGKIISRGSAVELITI